MQDPRRMTQGGAQQQEPPGDDTGAPGSEPAQDEAESPQEASGGQPGGDASGQQPPADESAAQDSGAMQQASPEEQQQYNQFVGRAMELIYDQKLFPHLVEMLRGGSGGGQDQSQQGQQDQKQQDQSSQDTGVSGPAAGLANATAMIIVRVYKAASDAGANLSPDVVFHGGTEIFGQLAEVSDKAGISDYANDRDKLEGAYFLAVDMATQQLRKAGVVDEAQAKAALEQVHGMDAKGELEQVFKELDAHDQGQSDNGGDQQAAPDDNSSPPTQGGMAPQQGGQ